MTTPNGMCLCGCQLFTTRDRWGRYKPFVPGHYVRVARKHKSRADDQLRCMEPLSREGRLMLADARVTTALLLAERYPADASYALALTARRNERDRLAERRQSA